MQNSFRLEDLPLFSLANESEGISSADVKVCCQLPVPVHANMTVCNGSNLDRKKRLLTLLLPPKTVFLTSRKFDFLEFLNHSITGCRYPSASHTEDYILYLVLMRKELGFKRFKTERKITVIKFHVLRLKINCTLVKCQTF